jgi:hypothetical protein
MASECLHRVNASLMAFTGLDAFNAFKGLDAFNVTLMPVVSVSLDAIQSTLSFQCHAIVSLP